LTQREIDRSRPGRGSGSVEVKQATTPSIARPTDTIESATLWRLLLDCPPDALYWASLGWRVGLLEGQADERKAIARAGEDLIRAPQWHETIKRPTYDELAARRDARRSRGAK